MASISRKRRAFAAVAVWLGGIGLFLGFALWNISTSRLDDENRLISEAGRTAAQLASLLSLPGWNLDAGTAGAIISGAMEDDRIYAVRIRNSNGFEEGQRRNYLWEPVPWDDEIAENCAQGMNPIRVGGEYAGTVDVWLSPRLNEEENALLSQREWMRFLCFLILWTAAFFMVLWQWGDLRRLKRYMAGDGDSGENKRESEAPEKIILGLSRQESAEKREKDNSAPGKIVDAVLGRKYQQTHPDSFRVTAVMFRQTFSRGPALISRLYAEGETAGLCHLGRMLEQAAPCIGAERLTAAAKNMQNALNDPECEAKALPVEECASALEDVLNALCGDNKSKTAE